MKRVCILVLACLLPLGCALHQVKSNQLANQLRSQPPERVLDQLSSIQPDETDIAQYYLNLGYLQLITGQFPSSIESFNKAKKQMQKLQATSVSENVAAGTINETFRQYSGTPTDRVMVHNMLALAYLFNNDIYGARVEMLQADVEMKSLVSSKELYGQLASTHLLAGIIYELLDERSNAFISYRFSEELLEKRHIKVPIGLQLSLLRSSQKMGNTEQYLHYQEKYKALDKQYKSTDKQLFFIYFDGVVSNKMETGVMVPSYNNEQLIRIAMPSYPANHYHARSSSLQTEEAVVTTQLLENIEQLAREDLSKDYPSILAMTTSRAIAKYQLVKKANKQDSLVGAIANIATVVSEVADLRSWNMLPSSWQFSYIQSADKTANISGHTEAVDLSQAQQHLFLKTSLSNQIFHYQQ